MKNTSKQILELTKTAKLHHAYLQDIVKTVNQIIENINTMKDFVNLLTERVNQAEDHIMELAREIYKNQEGQENE